MFKLFTQNKEVKVEVAQCPFPYESDECSKFLNKAYENSINETVLLEPNLYEDICYYCEIGNEIEKLKREKKKIENILKSEMKEYENAYCKEVNVTWKSVTKTIIDSKRLKQDHPDIAREYSKTTTTRVFKVR